MNLSRKWLREFVTVDAGDRDFAEAMTLSGSKVEITTDLGAEISNVVVGRVLSMERHPNSDHMWICQINVGQAEPIQIVTGAWNVHVGDLVPAALHKSTLPGGVKIEKGKLRGVVSNGMLCSLKELGLTDAELTTLTANLSKEYTGGSTEPETKSYVKVTAAPEDWSGTYLIVNEADETSAYVFNGNDAVNGYVSATIANSKITSSTELDAVAVTIEKTTDGYTLKVNGQYIYGTDGKNTLKFTDTAANAVNTITLSETDGVIITSNPSVLRFNSASNQMRFRYYKASTYSDQQAIQLYKLEG
mgnify:CR=1 FL=1